MNTIFMNSALELDQFLKNTLGSSLKTDSFYFPLGTIIGTYEGIPFAIFYQKGSQMTFTIESQNQTMGNFLYLFMWNFMEKAPFYGYDHVQVGSQKTWNSTVTWELQNKPQKMKKMIHKLQNPKDSIIRNLTFYGIDRTSIVQDKTIDFPRIHGIDSSMFLNRDTIQELSERELYEQITYLEQVLERIWKQSQKEHYLRAFDEEMIEEIEYAIEFCTYQTIQFGVRLPEPRQGSHIIVTSSYLEWYHKMEHHFQDEEIDKITSAFQKNISNLVKYKIE